MDYKGVFFFLQIAMQYVHTHHRSFQYIKHRSYKYLRHAFLMGYFGRCDKNKTKIAKCF